MAGVLRERATVVVIRDGKVLLVRGSSGRFREFAMPGGGIENGELPIVAAARELHEETNLRASSIEYLLTYETAIHRHVAFRVEADWIDALSGNRWFSVPRLQRTKRGACVGQVRDASGVMRASTLLSWIPGRRRSSRPT